LLGDAKSSLGDAKSSLGDADISTCADGQVEICRRALKPLLAMNKDGRAFDASERMRLSSGLLTNLFLHPKNGTRFYIEEMRIKSDVIDVDRRLLQEEMRGQMSM
jgi:hypothetical protein